MPVKNIPNLQEIRTCKLKIRKLSPGKCVLMVGRCVDMMTDDNVIIMMSFSYFNCLICWMWENQAKSKSSFQESIGGIVQVQRSNVYVRV